MKISADVYSYIDTEKLLQILDGNKELKKFIDMEIDRMTDEGLIKKCKTCHGGCCSSCGSKDNTVNEAYLTTALISVFNYYIPHDIQNAINMGGSTFIE